MTEPAFGPAWRRIAADIASGIPDRWAVGTKIPSHAQMQETYGVSVQPVQAAIRHLQDRGVLRGHKGLGVVVVRIPTPEDLPEDPATDTSRLTRIELQLAEQDERIRRLEGRGK